MQAPEVQDRESLCPLKIIVTVTKLQMGFLKNDVHIICFLASAVFSHLKVELFRRLRRILVLKEILHILFYFFLWSDSDLNKKCFKVNKTVLGFML
jgi:hypothetical protein